MLVELIHINYRLNLVDIKMKDVKCTGPIQLNIN